MKITYLFYCKYLFHMPCNEKLCFNSKLSGFRVSVCDGGKFTVL